MSHLQKDFTDILDKSLKRDKKRYNLKKANAESGNEHDYTYGSRDPYTNVIESTTDINLMVYLFLEEILTGQHGWRDLGGMHSDPSRFYDQPITRKSSTFKSEPDDETEKQKQDIIGNPRESLTKGYDKPKYTFAEAKERFFNSKKD